MGGAGNAVYKISAVCGCGVAGGLRVPAGCCLPRALPRPAGGKALAALRHAPVFAVGDDATSGAGSDQAVLRRRNPDGAALAKKTAWRRKLQALPSSLSLAVSIRLWRDIMAWYRAILSTSLPVLPPHDVYLFAYSCLSKLASYRLSCA